MTLLSSRGQICPNGIIYAALEIGGLRLPRLQRLSSVLLRGRPASQPRYKTNKHATEVETNSANSVSCHPRRLSCSSNLILQVPQPRQVGRVDLAAMT